MSKVLVTGASGFVGRHCAAELAARGYEVHALTRRADADAGADVTWHRGSLLDVGPVEEVLAAVRPRALLHLAWHQVPGELYTSLDNHRWVASSLRLLEAFRTAGGERVVMAGSSAEYDWRYGYCSEDVTPLAPRSVYGVCKKALGALFRSFCDGTAVSGAWARIFFLYGPHEHPRRLVASVVRSLLAGDKAKTSHGGQLRDYLHVEDAARALVTLLAGDVTGAVNVGSGRPTALGDIITGIGRRLDAEHLVEWGAVPVPEDDPPLVVADVRRLRSEVGWSPRLSLDQGLEQTIAWWRRELGEPDATPAA